MKTEVTNLLETENISEIEIVELIHTYQKLVNFGILTNEGFEDILNRLGVEKTNDKVYLIDEDIEYTLP